MCNHSALPRIELDPVFQATKYWNRRYLRAGSFQTGLKQAAILYSIRAEKDRPAQILCWLQNPLGSNGARFLFLPGLDEGTESWRAATFFHIGCKLQLPEFGKFQETKKKPLSHHIVDNTSILVCSLDWEMRQETFSLQWTESYPQSIDRSS